MVGWQRGEQLGERAAPVVTLVNPLGPDESVDLVLGHAQTGLTGPIEGVMDGSAYGRPRSSTHLRAGRTPLTSHSAARGRVEARSNTT